MHHRLCPAWQPTSRLPSLPDRTRDPLHPGGTECFMRTFGKMVVLNIFTVIVAPMLLVYLTHRDPTSTSRRRVVALRRLIARDY
jgi:hypothetical protein